LELKYCFSRAAKAYQSSGSPPGEIPPGEPGAHRFFFRASHVDLLLAAIGHAGLSGKPPGALADAIAQVAASIGAPYQTPDQLRRVAEQAVDEVQERVAAMRQNGGLKEVNRSYKAYRKRQIVSGERVIPYSAYLQRFTTIVRDGADDLVFLAASVRSILARQTIGQRVLQNRRNILEHCLD
jgi:hypothetical protein